MFKIFLYIKLQYKLLITLILVLVLPLFAIYYWSPVDIERTYIAFLGALALIRYLQINESQFRGHVRGASQKSLEKELGRVPSKKQVAKRIDEFIIARNSIISIVALLIILLAIIFKDL